MIAHYFTSAWHHFRRHKVTTLINVSCLTFGLVAFLLSWGSAEYLLRGDHYHSQSDRTVVFTRAQPMAQFTFHITPWTLGDHVRTDFPDLRYVARAAYPAEMAIVVDGEGTFANASYVDPDFVRIFDLPFVAGAARTALDQPRSAVVSAALAQRLFGATDVVGRTFRLSGREEAIQITGVIDEPQRPSHLSTGEISAVGMYVGFEMLLSMDLNPGRDSTNWEQDAYFTYAVLPNGGADAIARFDREMKDFTARRVPPELRDEMIYGARPIADFLAIGMDAIVRTDATGISGFTVLRALGLLVLAIACLNYTNLATAIAMTRAKEVALRKAVGATRANLILQHVGEGLLLSFASLAAALIIVALIVLAVSPATLTAAFALFAKLPVFWLTLLGTAVGVGILASAYPALTLSVVRPAVVLRGGKTGGTSRILSTALVGTQFAASSLLMIAAVVLLDHYRDIRTAVWNPASDPMLAIANDLRSAKVNLSLLKTELERQPGIRSVSAMHRMPWTPGGDSDGFALTPEAASGPILLQRTVVAADFFATMDISLLAGRAFEASRADDTANMKAWFDREAIATEFHALVDSSFLPTLGVATPAAAIDRVIYRPISLDGSKPPQRVRIIGVVEPSSFMPMNGGMAGVFFMNPEYAVVPVVRLARDDVSRAIDGLDRVWHQLAPETPLKRRFADEQFELGFGAFSTVNRAIGVLALLASLIAVVGLIGMALHTTRRRLHEIGVRKTLGATVPAIVTMLLRQFLKPVLIANLLVWPLVYVMMSAYLSVFANRAPLTAAPFVSSLALSLFVASIAVGAQALRAARMRPADVLRYE